ncbi:MAG TPA: 1-(5-phosphoribosyl)-5-[(5-phosphoribosylamino)methylideneamino] imidazole-4-carboxamide isomerase [Steroidobacteraceae bacterium]|nr:1-(5-phosphoribosyl)-5-[(5-phosphoribosylamino)methylideneamino] imidazole-4-carboxamide isomerase [Steroidobacteraceae bacterium]
MQLIPAIDLRGGKCVRLLHGRFDAETVYADDPRTVLAAYLSLGARLIHVVDLDGARDGEQGNREALRRLIAAAPGVALQVGGGVRSRAIAEELLALGVARVVVGSLAVTDAAEVQRWIADLGTERVVLAFDVRVDAAGTPQLATHGWKEQTAHSLWDAVLAYLDHGLGHVLCTDVARDGALSGPNLALYAECVRRFPAVSWQASGGVSGPADLAALAATGVSGAISGRALLEGRLNPRELEPFLPNA